MVDRESHLEDKVTQTDLETEVETLEQMKMQEEIHLSYLAKVNIRKVHAVYFCLSSYVCVSIILIVLLDCVIMVC